MAALGLLAPAVAESVFAAQAGQALPLSDLRPFISSLSMNFLINLHGPQVAYTLKKSARARRLRVTVHCDGAVVVTLPYSLPQSLVPRFLSEKARWLLSKMAHFARFGGASVIRYTRRDYLLHRERARSIVTERVAQLNLAYGFRYGAIAIKDQKTCWGSCSRRGNLNFNYKIVFLPDHVRDYVIIHELCHLQEMNHSGRFWALVERAVPNHRAIRKLLRKTGLGFM